MDTSSKRWLPITRNGLNVLIVEPSQTESGFHLVPLIGNCQPPSFFGNTLMGLSVLQEERILELQRTLNALRSALWVNTDDTPEPLMLNIEVRNPNAKRLSLL